MRAVNLIPADQRSSAVSVPSQSGGAVYILLAAIAGLVLLVVLYGSASHQVTTKRSEAKSLSAQAQSVEAEANRLTPYTAFVTLHDERVQALAQLVGTRFDWAHAFHELGRVLPTDVVLSSVQGTIASSAPTGSSGSGSSGTSSGSSASVSTNASSGAVKSATPAGSVPALTLTGCTVSQSEVAVTLARLRLIDGVTNVQLQNSAKSGSSGSSSGSGGGAGATTGPCPPGGPTFSAQISFSALPTPSTGGTAGAPIPVASTSTRSGSGARSSEPSGSGSHTTSAPTGRVGTTRTAASTKPGRSVSSPTASISTHKTAKGSR